MSLNNSSMIGTEHPNSTECTLEMSALNNNVNLSRLDLSEIINSDGTIHATESKTQKDVCSVKLSITLDQVERAILEKNHIEGSPMDVSTLENSNVESISRNNTDKSTSTSKDLNCTTFEETSMITEVLDEDESVIPLDDEDDVENDKLSKESTVDHEQTQVPVIQEEIFSHLQLDKTTTDEAHSNQATFKEQDVIETYNDVENSSYVIDESILFQYPFIEVGRRLWPSCVEKQHYTKGCLWSPDGTCLLVPVHLDGMHIVELPTDLYNINELSPARNLSRLNSAVHVKEGGTVYDFCWYPFMNSGDPATCGWLATRQHEPIHMWDAFTGELRCSYRGYDNVDEVESAISIIFSNDGQKVIGGYKKTIKIFDTNIPGRDCSSIPVKKAVSCFALTTENDNTITVGTWTGYINHYDLRAPKLGPLFTLGGHQGGITWLKYTQTEDQNWYLFSGARKDNKILQWDMRNYKEPIQVFERTVQTNQRIYYDLTPLHTWLASGDTQGLLKIWNLGNKDNCFELPIHQDCCNGVSFHPLLPIISTTSGQYHFFDDSETNEITSENYIDYENALLLLWYGPSREYET